MIILFAIAIFSLIADTGIEGTEEVKLKNLEKPNALFKRKLKYLSSAGDEVTISYVVDENGYVPLVTINKAGQEEAEYKLQPMVGADVLGSLMNSG